MSKITRIFCAGMLLLVYSCQKADENATFADVNGSSPSYYRTIDEAVSSVQTMLGQNTEGTRSATLDLADYSLYHATPKTRSSVTDDDLQVSFHVLNFADNGGFAIVSADKRTTAVYAYSEKGHIDIYDAVANTGFEVFMEGAAAYFKKEIEEYSYAPMYEFIPVPDPDNEIPYLMITYLDGVPYHTRSEDILDKQVGYYTTTLWDQNAPYNNKAPLFGTERAPAGCGAIAMAQIMAYYEYPTKTGEYNIDWKEIKSTPTISRNSSYANVVATLISEINKRAKALYGVKATSTNTTNSKTTLESYGYKTDAIQDYYGETVKSSLDKNHLVFCRGSNFDDDGHAWVIDGYKKYKNKRTYYSTIPPYKYYTTIIYEGPLYVHCNWGWGTQYTTNAWCLDLAFMIIKNDGTMDPDNIFMFENQIIPNVYK